MEIKCDTSVDIMSDHESAPSHVDQQLTACANSTGTAVQKEMPCLLVVIIAITMSLAVIPFLSACVLVIVFISIIVPGIMLYLSLAHWITGLIQFAKYDDYADIDDEYNINLGAYRYQIVVWMMKLAGGLIIELLVYVALLRIMPFHLWQLAVLGLPVWKWFIIGIILLSYFGLWLFTRICFHKARETITTFFYRVRILPILDGMFKVALCGFYFLVEPFVSKLAPLLKQHKILGLPAHKWGRALIYLFIAYNVSDIISASVVALLQKKHEYQRQFACDSCCKGNDKASDMKRCEDLPDFIQKLTKCNFPMRLFAKRQNCIVYLVIRLRRSINLVLVSIWVLATWTSKFEQKLSPSKDGKQIRGVGTKTLICLVMLAVLWLVKNSIMLWWEYRSMYLTFRDQMLEAWTNFYLLLRVCGEHLDVLSAGRDDIKNKKNGKETETETQKDVQKEQRRERVIANASTLPVHDLTSIKGDYRRKGDRQFMNTRDDNKTYQPSIYAVMRMVRYFLLAEHLFKTDESKGIGQLIKKWRQAHHPYDQRSREKLSWKHIQNAYGTKLIPDDDERKRNKTRDDFGILYSQIGSENPSLKDFEIWMERSYRSCFNMVHTLASARRLADYLNHAMIASIILITSGISLIVITGNKEAVTLFSEFLTAISFIFQDACSTIFNGIIISYIIHPYDVGDLCIINETLYEVKEISFWKTTLLNLKTNERVFYPHSALSTLSIINKTKEGVLEDRVEFIIESDTDKKMIEELTQKINQYFCCEDPPKTFERQPPQVENDIGKSVTVIVLLKYNLKKGTWVSNSEFVEEMEKSKQELQRRVRKWCTELKIKPAKNKSG